ncbi:DUF2301 domain-containing membrane protein [Lonepinella sp. BR2919]|uniref:DUF2301 domain-containing membrane protein n=1 Tax=unclassified Lonepinella TaxID=2642006 RepID=UPI003F6E3F0C
MADPHIKSPMDFLDYLTVCLYRTGFILAAIFTALLPYYEFAQIGILAAALLCASSLHIYLKKFRLLLQFATWLALFFQIIGQTELALGAALVTLGGLCFKEYFCFRIFALNLMPIFVALLWLTKVAEITIGLHILSIICTALFAVLAIQKWRMPLHFDIGDKGKYQV